MGSHVELRMNLGVVRLTLGKVNSAGRCAGDRGGGGVVLFDIDSALRDFASRFLATCSRTLNVAVCVKEPSLSVNLLMDERYSHVKSNA